VYLSDGKVKHLVFGMDTLVALGYSLSDIVGVEDSELNHLQTGEKLAIEHLSTEMKAKYSKRKNSSTLAPTVVAKDDDTQTDLSTNARINAGTSNLRIRNA